MHAYETHESPDDMLRAAPLDAAKRTRAEEIVVRLAQLSRAFVENLAAATAGWTKHVPDEAALEGMPGRARRRARLHAQAQQQDGFLLTLDAPSYADAVQHLADRKLRHDVYEAYVTRASDHGPRALHFDNTPLVHETLALRHELALLLGFENYAELALRHGVLRTPDDVEHYLLRNGAEARARAQAELDTIWAFAKAKGAPKGFSTWDLGYYAMWLKREQLGFDEDDLRAYFALPNVLAGLFALTERLLGVRVVAPTVAARTGEVRTYTLIAHTGEELGHLALEPSTPAGPLEGAGVDVSYASGQPPLLRVRCDLEVLEDGQPALLTHAALRSLFRGVGAGLYLLLARLQQADAPGLRYEHATASQIGGSYFELFTTHFDTLATLARHHASGAVLPRELFDQLIRSRDFHAGLAAALELELALFDLRVHRDYVPVGKATQLRMHVLDTLAQVRREVCVLRPPFWERMANTCPALFAEGRAGRIWEISWAKQMAAEMFAQLEASGFAPATARRLRDTFWVAGDRDLRKRLTDALGQTPKLLP